MLNIWELDNSSDDLSYDDSMPGLLNRCDMDDSLDNGSDDESDNCDNVNKNKTGVTRNWIIMKI